MRSTRGQLGGFLLPFLPLPNNALTAGGLISREVANCFFRTPARSTSSSRARQKPASKSIASDSDNPASLGFSVFGAANCSLPCDLPRSRSRFG